MREVVVLAALLRHPDLVQRFEPALERLIMSEANETVKGALLRLDDGSDDLEARLTREVGEAALERIRAAPHVRLSLGAGRDRERAALCLDEQLAMLSAQGGARRELQEALESRDAVDENVVWRVAQAARSLFVRRQEGAGAEYEVAENGAEVPREERERSRAFYDSIVFDRGRRKLP
jgi:DNA primase